LEVARIEVLLFHLTRGSARQVKPSHHNVEWTKLLSKGQHDDEIVRAEAVAP
jgi:hypothetical protein